MLNDNNETVQVQKSSLDPEIYNRPWKGIYFLYSMGDNHQLPPVMQKLMYSNDNGKQGTADFIGRIVLHDCINTHISAEVKSTVIVMNNIKRQNDADYLNFMDNLQNGTVNEQDVEFVYRKCLTNMAEDD